MITVATPWETFLKSIVVRAVGTHLFQEDLHMKLKGPNNVSWEVDKFYHVPLAGVINTLSTLQNSVLVAESVALNDILHAVETSDEL